MDSAIKLYRWNLTYARALVADLTPEQCTTQGGPGLENHPAWTIGHLVTGSDLLAEDLGLERDLPEGWRELFQRRGPGDPRLPSPDAGAYPPLEELLAELERQHRRVEEVWLVKLAAPGTGRPALDDDLEWRFHGALPTLGDAVLFFAVGHEAMHLGQLAAWRRAMGLPSALGAM